MIKTQMQRLVIHFLVGKQLPGGCRYITSKEEYVRILHIQC